MQRPGHRDQDLTQALVGEGLFQLRRLGTASRRLPVPPTRGGDRVRPVSEYQYYEFQALLAELRDAYDHTGRTSESASPTAARTTSAAPASFTASTTTASGNNARQQDERKPVRPSIGCVEQVNRLHRPLFCEELLVDAAGNPKCCCGTTSIHALMNRTSSDSAEASGQSPVRMQPPGTPAAPWGFSQSDDDDGATGRGLIPGS